MAVAQAIPIDENNRFLALLVSYVSRVLRPAAAAAPQGRMRGTAGCFAGYCALWAGAAARNLAPCSIFWTARKRDHGGIGFVWY